MTQNYHWNVEGSSFAQLHLLFEQQYTELFTAIDEIAERLRALGAYAPGTLKEFLLLSSISEDKKRPDSKGMILRLRDAHRQSAKSAQAAKEIATRAKDDETVDLMVGRITVHEKQAWMLTSLLK
jgi:starvation-inducible DNA-binding protein